MLKRLLRPLRSCATEEAEAEPGKDLAMIDPVRTKRKIGTVQCQIKICPSTENLRCVRCRFADTARYLQFYCVRFE